MEIEYTNLTTQIMNCNACSFRDPEIKPLTAAYVEPPVAIMFIGENPSWVEEQPEPPYRDRARAHAKITSHQRSPPQLFAGAA